MIDFTENRILKLPIRRIRVTRTATNASEDDWELFAQGEEEGFFSHKKFQIEEKGPVLTGSKKDRRRQYVDSQIGWEGLAQVFGCECCGRDLPKKPFQELFQERGEYSTLCEECTHHLRNDIKKAEQQDNMIYFKQERQQTSHAVWLMLCKV